MSIWSRLVEAAAAIGGPIAEFAGRILREAREAVDRARAALTGPPRDPTQSIAFTIGVVVLGAKMAIADGEVTDDEIATFHRVFSVPPDELTNVRRVFNLAKRDPGGYEPYARQIAELLGDRWRVKEELIAALFQIARADGRVTRSELDYLRAVSAILGFDDDDFDRIEATALGLPERDPYRILGVSPDADTAEIKKAWRRLVALYHPDRVMAEGLPPEFVELATQKVAAINAAYRGIMRLRKVEA